MDKILIHLCGGLGNQLFQYAFGRNLSLISGFPLALDVRTGFVNDRVYRRSYSLDVFNLPEEVERLVPNALHHTFLRAGMAVASKGLWEGAFRFEKDVCGDSSGVKYRPGRYVGYWQSENWFVENKEIIRADLTMHAPMNPVVSDYVEQLSNGVWAAVHVRRKEYKRALTEDYYHKAIPYLMDNLPGCRLLYFSDDPEWCKETLLNRFGGELMQEMKLTDLDEFRMMTNAGNYVIANSSFSWWAAWLGAGENGLVVSPESSRWADPESVPNHWVAL